MHGECASARWSRRLRAASSAASPGLVAGAASSRIAGTWSADDPGSSAVAAPLLPLLAGKQQARHTLHAVMPSDRNWGPPVVELGPACPTRRALSTGCGMK